MGSGGYRGGLPGLQLALAAALLAACVSTATDPTPAARAAATPVMDAAAFVREADELDAKASHHEELAAQYRERLPLWGRKYPKLRELADHCANLAKAYREAAASARAAADAQRQLESEGAPVE